LGSGYRRSTFSLQPFQDDYKHSNMTTNSMHYAFRLKPGEDLRAGIERAVHTNHIIAGWIATGVGSLTRYAIRFANQPGVAAGEGYFEIVSLTGTVSVAGCHLHISISNGTGATIGGHLLEGCKVYTTAEIIITATDNYIFAREKDDSTGWKELQVKENK
jgi:predicted DNA-binding protein with PD1-like motif